ncbi:hypothetical protein AX774_g6560 [Zancudomyces culisetae]|uniref:Uncharacterized protein n=1 Tax=Zancudomyces culisetae TaxID=1213189 RepID=A0A1R1PGE7_ZANCU|nr:hypothetical protein AX774_g6560 [Zancudomyces culisetae]|eukprot:OMH80008.1 hypothetical protein AX774_g6560 [Zancudomyces culisetae]
MDNTNNQHNVFNKLPASILSTVFVLAQNPQLSLLNKNMHYASQQVDTVCKYILQYILSITKHSFNSELRSIFEKYTRINMNEIVGILVFRKIKGLDYETALDIAFEYRWTNILNKLLKMYVVIDRNTSAVVHKGTLFMNEGEHLDIDISGLFSERNESRREENDIDISESLYVRPLFRVRGNSMDLEYQILDISEERDVKMLLDICNTRFEFFPEICGSFERDIICVGKEFLLYCLFTAGEVIVDLDNLELLKQLLDVKINTKFSFQDLQSITNSYGDSYDTEFNNFVMDYGNADKMDLLVYMICTFHSIH